MTKEKIHGLDNSAATSYYIFDEEDKSFEHAYSIGAHMLGLNVGHLPMMLFEHIGEKMSAYVLNNQSRVWDHSGDTLQDIGLLWTSVSLFE